MRDILNGNKKDFLLVFPFLLENLRKRM